MIGRRIPPRLGTLPTRQQYHSFLIIDFNLKKGKGNEQGLTTVMTTNDKTTKTLVMHLINTRLGAPDKRNQASKNIKECTTWTSTACLSGSTTSKLL